MGDWIFGVSMPFEEGRHRVSVRDIPQVVTSGKTEDEAVLAAVDAIETALAFYMKKGDPLPTPSPAAEGERRISISARMAAKAAVYEAWRESGLSKSELARRMGRDVVEVRRILEPNHGTKLDQLDEAARALGLRFTIGLAPV